jgi:hypothetical protein
MLQESCKRLQPSGGSAYCDDGERGQRQKIIGFGVPYDGAAVILRTRCRLIISFWCMHRRPGRTIVIEGAPRRLFGFPHDSLHSCEPRKRLCTLYGLFDYASLWNISSIEASRRYAGVHPEVRLPSEVASLRDEKQPDSRSNIECPS